MNVAPDASGKRIRCPRCEIKFQAAFSTLPDPETPVNESRSDRHSVAREHDAPNRPKRRKTRKDKSSRQWAVVGLLVVGTIVTLGVVGTVVFLSGSALSAGRTSPSIAAPERFEKFEHPSGAFQCVYPTGWDARGAGKKDYGWAKFESGNIQVSLAESLTGSILGDIAGTAVFGGGDNRDLSRDPREEQQAAVLGVHALKGSILAKERDGYEEGPPEFLQVKMGNVALSAFREPGWFGNQLRGYRGTLLGGNRQIDIMCTCAEADWPILEPTFRRMIESLERGRRQ